MGKFKAWLLREDATQASWSASSRLEDPDNNGLEDPFGSEYKPVPDSPVARKLFGVKKKPIKIRRKLR